MATYKQIQEDIKGRHQISVKIFWIANVKRQHGKTTRLATDRLDPKKISMSQNQSNDHTGIIETV